jgi:UTP--glucose-1-phosphate uridylyltransferase
LGGRRLKAEEMAKSARYRRNCGQLAGVHTILSLHCTGNEWLTWLANPQQPGDEIVRTKVTTAIFPIAGLGTRFLPATKCIPKEILTIVDRPLIQYAMDEARAAGIRDFIFVTARGKSALEDYFDLNPGLEHQLRKAGKTDLLAALKETNVDSGHLVYVRQHQPLGLGHAVWCARRIVGDRPFAVILPDDLIVAEKPCLEQMMEVHEEFGGSVIAAMEVAPDRASAYGILDVVDTVGRVLRPRGIVEKPAPGTAPSNKAVIGRYILSPRIMRHLNAKAVGAGGEIQLTDAIALELAQHPDSVIACRFDGTRYDCGTKAGMLQATVAIALSRPDLCEEFRDFLTAHTVAAPKRIAVAASQ